MAGEGTDEQHSIGSASSNPKLRELFQEAIEFLHLAGADRDAADSRQSSEVNQKTSHLNFERKEGHPRKANCQVAKKPVMLASERKKLERIKAPITIFKKQNHTVGLSEEDQEIAVQKALQYVERMPFQEEYRPPPVPCVTFADKEKNKDQNEGATSEKYQGTSAKIQDFTYLSNEKEIFVWKMLVDSPKNCNVFVGGLSQNVAPELLLTAFKTFCPEEEKSKLKAHVVMDVARQQSKGYGFVTFPSRRSAEMAMICMQEFEIHGKSIQLGWGQEDRASKLTTSASNNSSNITGKVVTDTIYNDKETAVSKKTLKRRLSRWDQDTQAKLSRLLGSRDTQESPAVISNDNQASCSLLKAKACAKQLCQNKSDSATEVTLSLGSRSQWAQAGDAAVLLSTKKSNACSIRSLEDQLKDSVETMFKPLKLCENRTDCSKQSKDGDYTATEISTKTCRQKRVNICTNAQTLLPSGALRGTSNIRRSAAKPKKTIEWLTHDQKVALIKSVCTNLRDAGVHGHLGVFGVYYQTDNSRLYVVCAKHITELQLLNECTLFGAAEVKLNKDMNGFSKGCAYVQFSDSNDAEKAMKQLHGKVLGGLPMKAMFAEPKIQKGMQVKKIT